MWSLHIDDQYINARHIKEVWFSWVLGCFLTSAICSGLWVPSLPFFQSVCMGEWYWKVKTVSFPSLHIFSLFLIIFLLLILLSLLYDIKEWHSHWRFLGIWLKRLEVWHGEYADRKCVCCRCFFCQWVWLLSFYIYQKYKLRSDLSKSP